MILRHSREPVEGQPIENTFVAIDERSGSTLGSCTIFQHHNDQLFPARPERIYLEIEGSPVPDALLGAAVARAKELGRSSGGAARVFTQVLPDDSERMEALKALGFRDNDGLIQMRHKLPCTDETRLPVGCVVVTDDLDDPIERKYFLERYNQLYQEEFDYEWLHDYCSKTGFLRILIVSQTGMVGETCIWQEGEAGMIGWLQTAKKWRGMGIARSLIELSCAEFEKRGLAYGAAEVQAKIPGVLKLMEHTGFTQAQLLYRYPGIDM